MKRAAVICEFNPFHNGHKFLLEKIRKEYADEIVCIMSGNFVQRGELAVVNKYERAAAALLGGADIVAELPTPYALSSAAVFAQNGVRLAKALHCDILCFGAEDNLDTLKEITDALDDYSVKELIRQKMKDGDYYPRALTEAVAERGEDAIADAMKQPNNILALEYIKACRAEGIFPVAIRRKDVPHDSPNPVGNIASGSCIRDLIADNADVTAFTPMKIEKPAALSALENAILYILKTSSREEIATLADVSEGLENRIYEAAQEYNSTEEILTAVKTKRYTHARLRRILLCALLGITSDIQNTPVPYVRILGVRKRMENLIPYAALPLVVRVKADYDKLDHSSKEIFNIDLKATQAMNLARNEHINEFSQGIIKN
ncbi:MAG: nucleotidyltransferase family protein [Ruminococcus sp.]|nr:nucleotidyltransferase family protein [Ruminococcus sp.]